MTSERGGRDSFFGSNHKKKHTKRGTFKLEFRQIQGHSERMIIIPGFLSQVDDISKITGRRKMVLPSVLL